MIQSYWYCNHCNTKLQENQNTELSLVCNVCGASPALDYKGVLRWEELEPAAEGVLRYAPLLPVTPINLAKVVDPKHPEFFSPVESKKLASILGVASVHLLPAISGPSGTFKDTEASVVIAKCLDLKVTQPLSWHSTGNTARAYREYAIKAGFQSASYFPLVCLRKFRGIEKNEKNIIIAYDGPFQDIAHIAKEQAKERGTLHLAPFSWKLEGKATLAYATFEHIPDASMIVQTIAGGYGPLGFQLGIERLQKLKLLKGRQPRYCVFQISGADTISRLMPLNREVTETDLQLPVNPFEPTLQSTNPLSTFSHVRNLLTTTDSTTTSIGADSTTAHRDVFEKECHDLGINISFEDEHSPFISWAGLVQQSQRKKISPKEKIVIIITGSMKRIGSDPEPNIIIRKK